MSACRMFSSMCSPEKSRSPCTAPDAHPQRGDPRPQEPVRVPPGAGDRHDVVGRDAFENASGRPWLIARRPRERRARGVRVSAGPLPEMLARGSVDRSHARLSGPRNNGGSPATGCRAGLPRTRLHQGRGGPTSIVWRLVSQRNQRIDRPPFDVVTPSPDPAGNDTVGTKRGSTEAVRDRRSMTLGDTCVIPVSPLTCGFVDHLYYARAEVLTKSPARIQEARGQGKPLKAAALALRHLALRPARLAEAFKDTVKYLPQ